jgi:integrase
MRIELSGELARVVDRIISPPRKTTGPSLTQDEHGNHLMQTALRSRFDKARKLAGIDSQFRDIRAKAATDADDLQFAQKLLAHKHQSMTHKYTRTRKGEKIRPFR